MRLKRAKPLAAGYGSSGSRDRARRGGTERGEEAA